jgi:hypothetical protein
MPHVCCVVLVALVVLATPHWVTSGSAHQSSILVILEGKSTPKPKPNPWPICIPTVGHGCPP